jgi:ABC-type glutathione transport system ATPase component
MSATGVEAPDVAEVGGHPEPVVSVRNLVKRFGEVEAVRGVSFSVAPGEAFGFLGPNGAGESTTISILCTLLRPTSGDAEVAGFDVVRDPLGARRRIGLVFQDPTLDEYLTAEHCERRRGRSGLPDRRSTTCSCRIPAARSATPRRPARHDCAPGR